MSKFEVGMLALAILIAFSVMVIAFTVVSNFIRGEK